MKKLKLKLIAGLFLPGALLLISCSTKTYMGRWMTWRASDILDYQKFPGYSYDASRSPFRFRSATNSAVESLAVTVKGGEEKRPLNEVLKDSETTAFIVISSDTILVESYMSGYSRESTNTSFSVAKSITSLMIGKAIDDGLIRSVDDPVTQYLPQLLSGDSKYRKPTISEVLDMRSGIQFKDHDLPWGDKPKAYYHPRLRDRLNELPLTFEPGSKFQYNSYNPILAGMILEEVTNQPPAKYFEEKIWNKLGMEFPGSWSMDSDESGMTKMESGLNITAIDLAKLGRLVLNKGSWDGEQIISEAWMKASRAILPENKVPEFGDEIHYEKFWWLFSSDNDEAYIISGWGHLGQYLYIFPKENVIIVRMGKDTGKVESWKKIFQEVVDSIST